MSIKRKKSDTNICPTLFRKHRTPYLSHMCKSEKGNSADIQGKCAPLMLSRQNYRSLCTTQHALGTVINKQVKGNIFAKRINAHIEHIKYSKSQESFLKFMKENDEKEKEAKESAPWVKWQCQPALPTRRRHLVRTPRKEPDCWNPSLVNSGHNRCGEWGDYWTVKIFLLPEW